MKINNNNTHIQPFYGSMDFVQDNLGEPVPEETFTHSQLSWSSIIPYLLHPSITIHGILHVQSTCMRVFFHNLSPSFLWSTSWPGTLHFILHTFLHPITVFFSQYMPIPLQTQYSYNYRTITIISIIMNKFNPTLKTDIYKIYENMQVMMNIRLQNIK